MAMLIAWQTVNAVRRPNSQITKGFLIVTPGLTIRDRLNVLKPNDTYNYYEHRDLVPKDMLQDMQRAVVIIENFHKFKHRERISLAKGTRRMIEGRRDGEIKTLETDGAGQRLGGFASPTPDTTSAPNGGRETLHEVGRPCVSSQRAFPRFPQFLSRAAPSLDPTVSFRQVSSRHRSGINRRFHRLF